MPKKKRPKLRFPVPLLYAVFLVSLLEGGSWLGGSLLHGKIIGYGDIMEAERNRASLIAREQAGGNALEAWEEVPHPYFGASHPVIGRINHRSDGESETLADYGFIDPSGLLYKERDPNRIIVNITGGSVARGFIDNGGYLVLKEELQKLPAFAGKDIVFSSTAFYGHKQPQQLTAIAYMMSLGAKFDVIINIDGVNELIVGTMYNGDASPYYPFKWHERMSLKYPDLGIHAQIGKIQYLKEKRVSLAQHFQYLGVGSSMAGSLLWQVLDARIAEQVNREQYNLASQFPIQATEGLLDTGPVPQYESDDAYLRDMASVWEESVRQLARLSEGNTILFFTFLQPNQYVGHHPFTEEERAIAWYDDGPYRPLIQGGYPLLRSAGATLRSEGIAFGDMTDVFDDVTEPVYTDDCCHFNSPGPNAILARKIAQFIAAEYGEQ